MANKNYVDREIPFKVYENYLEYLQSSNTNNGVLYYWGVGGSGKSRFLTKIKNNCADKNIIHMSYDYDNSDFYSVIDLLKRLYNSIKNNQYTGKIDEPLFIRFEKALCLYCVKYNNKNHLLFNNVDTNGSRSTSSIIDFIKFLAPAGITKTVNMVKVVARAGEELEKNIRYKIKKNLFKDDFEEMDEVFNDDYLTQDYLIKNVINNFVLDYNDYVDELNKNNLYNLPLVISLDALEQLIDEYYDRKNKNNQEMDYKKWIIGQNGFIFKLKNTLVVLAGRDQIIKINNNCCDIYDGTEEDIIELFKGSENHSSSLEHYSYNINNSLDIFEKGKEIVNSNNVIYCYKLDFIKEKYIIELLENNGIVDKDVQRQIYSVSSGFPLYVSLCIGMYNETIEAGKTPTISDYQGKLSDVIQRYFKFFSEDNIVILYTLALLGRWQDEEMEEISNHDDAKMYSYEKIKKNSFITKDGDNRYIFHRVVKETLLVDEDLSSRFDSVVNKILDLYIEKPKLIKNLYQINRLSDISKMNQAKNNNDLLIKIKKAHDSIDPDTLLQNNQYFYDVDTSKRMGCVTEEILSGAKEALYHFDKYEYYMNDELNDDIGKDDLNSRDIEWMKQESDSLLTDYELYEDDGKQFKNLTMLCAYFQLKEDYDKASKYYCFLINFINYFKNEVKKPLVTNEGYDEYIKCAVNCLVRLKQYKKAYEMLKQISTDNIFVAANKVEILNCILKDLSIDEKEVEYYTKEKQELEDKYNLYYHN